MSARERIEKIVPRRAWLRRGSLSAYAVVNRRLVPLLDKEGLIDGDYLDSVSNELSREFSALLAIEVA
jgi:hypothetical protein